MARKYRRLTTQTWFGLFRHYGGWAAILGAVVFVVLTAISVWQYASDHAYVDRAVPVQGEVLGYDQAAYFRDGQVLAKLRVDSPQGVFTSEVPVDFLFDIRHPVGSTMALYYVRGTPATLAFALPDPDADGWIFQLAAGFVGVITLCFGGYAAMRTTDAIRARCYGAFTKATVLHKETVHRWRWEALFFKSGVLEFFGSDSETDMARLVFRDREGCVHKSLPHHVITLAAFKTHDEIDVYRGLRRNWWFNDLGPRRTHNSNLPNVPARPDQPAT